MSVAGRCLDIHCQVCRLRTVFRHHLGIISIISRAEHYRFLGIEPYIVSILILGDDISDVPAVGIAPEWMSEKALAIASYCAASGAYVILGVNNPVEGSDEVVRIMSEGWESAVGGKIEFIVDEKEMIKRITEHIDKKREALGLPAYEPEKFGQSGDARMLELLELAPEERAEALYGMPAGD